MITSKLYFRLKMTKTNDTKFKLIKTAWHIAILKGKGKFDAMTKKRIRNPRKRIKGLKIKLGDVLNENDINHLINEGNTLARDDLINELRDQLDEGDYTIDIMVSIMNTHKSLGYNEAWLNWHKCSKPDGVSLEITRHQTDIKSIHREIERQKEDLSMCFELKEIEDILTECEAMRETTKEETESSIETTHRPTCIIFNKKALIDHTEAIIQMEIKILLSFGYKFLSPFLVTKKSMTHMMAQL